MGLKTSLFDIPACNSFKDKLINNQLCYEIDVNNFKDKRFKENDLKLGLSFLIDNNEIRQTKSKEQITMEGRKDLGKISF